MPKRSEMIAAALFLIIIFFITVIGLGSPAGVKLSFPASFLLLGPNQAAADTFVVLPAAERKNLIKNEKFYKISGTYPQHSSSKETDSKTANNNLALNKLTGNVNLLHIWEDQGKAKVITLLTVDYRHGKAGVLVIPLFTKLTAGGKETTAGQYYETAGIEGLQKLLEKLLLVKINNRIIFSQEAVRKASRVIGPFQVNGRQENMLDALEATIAGTRFDDQLILRNLARQIMKPGTMLKLPQLLWIFQTDVRADLDQGTVLKLFKAAATIDFSALEKASIPGRDYITGNREYREVPQTAWRNIIYELTR